MPDRPRIQHCRACGAPAAYRVPPDDNRERATCTACGLVDYENPINVVGTLPVLGDRVLLCRRAIEPRHGLWTLPAGFMELGETVEQGARRETDEESGARIDLGMLLTLFSVVRVGQVHLFFLAAMRDDHLDPGPETIEARLFAEHEVPWETIAFRTTRETLRHFFDCRRAGRFELKVGEIA